MPPFVLLSALLAVALGLAAGWVVFLRRKVRRTEAAMHRRLVETYPAAERTLATQPLRGPTGWVAVKDDGLCLALGPGEPDLREVPWSALREVVAVGAGDVAVHVAGVGKVHVPGTLARRLWDQLAGAQPGADRAGAERARAARV